MNTEMRRWEKTFGGDAEEKWSETLIRDAEGRQSHLISICKNFTVEGAGLQQVPSFTAAVPAGPVEPEPPAL